jgi:deazaflavin-dependent oxidoreductase (nitroreductase family)
MIQRRKSCGDGGLEALRILERRLSDVVCTAYGPRNGWEVGVVVAPMTTNAERSPTQWVRDQTEQILRTGTTDGVTVLDRPVVLFTVTGARSGKQRLVPLMRVEHEGRYAMIASKGGAPEHPAWYANVRANPEVTGQDGTVVARYVVREVHGVEREQWWARAVQAYPPYADYQEKTDRLIPVLVLDPVT